MKRGIPDDRVAVEVFIEAGDWQGALPASGDVCRRAATSAFEAARSAQPAEGAAEACIVLADDAMLRQLNHRFRGADRPTNVLSFPAAPDELAGASGRRTLGDIAVAFETASAEAAASGTPLTDHLSHLIVHGMLHLLGYDHEGDEDAEAMETLEVAILATLGVPSPYTGAGDDRD